MSTGNANLDLLIKLLSTATHPTTPDNIALVAMRKAGDQLAKFKTDWAGLLKGRITVVQDPFSQAVGPQVKSRPAPSVRRPPPPPPPPPAQPRPRPAQPSPVKPTPRPDPAATTTQAAQPRRTNQYPGKCYTCSRNVPAGSGFLAGQDSRGNYRVVCGNNFGHNAPYAQRSTRPQASADDIANLLDDTPF